jgi:hypothetical protein
MSLKLRACWTALCLKPFASVGSDKCTHIIGIDVRSLFGWIKVNPWVGLGKPSGIKQGTDDVPET